MTRRCGWLAGAAWLAVASVATATQIRIDGLGGVEGAVDDEATAYDLFTLGNAAGLGLQDGGNRVDEALATGRSDERLTSATGGTTATTEQRQSGWRLGSPGGGYEGVTFWLSPSDAFRAVVDVRSTSLLLTSSPSSSLVNGSQTGAGTDAAFELAYSRRVFDELAVGARVRPVKGRLNLPSFADPTGQGFDSTSQTVSYALLDYQLGAGVDLPLPGDGHALAVGANFGPFADAPDPLALLPATSGVPVELGVYPAYKTTVDLAATNGATVRTVDTPRGQTLGFQVAWTRSGLFAAAAAIETTRATVDRDQTTTLPAVAGLTGALSAESSGKASALARTRYLVGGRYRLALGETSAVRLAAAVRGTNATLDQFGLGDATTRIHTSVVTVTDLSLGAAIEVPDGVTVGFGLESSAGAQDDSDPRQPTIVSETRPVSTVLRLGGEYWVAPEWALRAGLAAASNHTDTNAQSEPPPGSDPANPILHDTTVSLGGGYRGPALTVDVAVLLHTIAQTPAVRPPDADVRSAFGFELGGRYAF